MDSGEGVADAYFVIIFISLLLFFFTTAARRERRRWWRGCSFPIPTASSNSRWVRATVTWGGFLHPGPAWGAILFQLLTFGNIEDKVNELIKEVVSRCVLETVMWV